MKMHIGNCRLPSAHCRLAAQAAAAVLACAVATGRARWIEDGVGGAWGTAPAEAVAAYVPWDDAERTRATVETLALAATAVDSNTVVLAGAGMEGVDGGYGLSYEDEWSAYYTNGDQTFEINVSKGEPPLYATLVDTYEWATRYETYDFPGEWYVAEGSGVAPAPAGTYASASVTSRVARVDTLRWDEAHGWGDHAAAGYLAEESDPLALRLDQTAPQAATGFPLWTNPEETLAGRAAQAGSTGEWVGDWGLSQVSELTVGFWVRTSSLPGGTLPKYLFRVADDTEGPGTAMLFRFEASADTLAVSFYNAGVNQPVQLSRKFAVDGAWHHLAASWKEGQATLYFDGVAVTSSVCAATIGYGTSHDTFVHGWAGGTLRTSTFPVDGFAAWTNALSAAEVRDLWFHEMDVRAGLAFPSTGRATTNGLYRLYRMDETSGTVIADGWGSADLACNAAPSRPVGVVRSGARGAAAHPYLSLAASPPDDAAAAWGLFSVGNARAGTVFQGALAVGALHAPPASATAPGLPGELRVAADAIYVCVATNTWAKAALAAW